MTSTGTLSAKVNIIRREAAEILLFELIGTEGQSLPPATPGSHIDVHVLSGLVRQYSLCNGPTDIDKYIIAVKREPMSRGGSAAMHETIKVGDIITISEPRNNFPVVWSAKRHLLLAAGIGITPILSMALHMNAVGAEFRLEYFTRSREYSAFYELLSHADFKGKVALHYALDVAALRSYLQKLLLNRPDGGHVYLCGPRPFMDLVQSVAAPTWPSDAIHLEYFSADPKSLSGSRGAFTVRLARSGGTYTIPEGKTIVDALAAHGVRIETSCEQGVCGTCLTGVLEGIPDHRDVYLSDEEKSACDKLLPCVSRSHSSLLVLDL